MLDNHLFDVSSIILSEGIPASEFGGHAETNSLEIEDSGKPKSNFVARFEISSGNFQNQSYEDSMTVNNDAVIHKVKI